MSIHDSILRHLGSELTCLESEFLGNETPRTIFVSSEVANVVLGPWPDTPDGRRHARARAVLDGFIEGDELTVGWDPFNKDGRAILARVSPITARVFDFRCLDPNPGIRILGSFAEVDTFVALVWEYRENLESAEDWNSIVRRSQAEWKRLFGDDEALFGASLNDHLTYNALVV